MSGWWVHEYYQAGLKVALVSQIFWVLLSITLHELAHGWAAIWQGDDTPRRLGRLTANPLVHMGPWSLLFLALVGIAWGVMPVDPSRFRWGRRGRVVVSGAGPAMNVALAVVSLGALVAWLAAGPRGSDVHETVAIFLYTGGWLNLLLALFNMLPVPPLDGASVLSGLSLRIYRFYQQPNAQMIGMFIVLVLVFSGCGGMIFGGLRQLAVVAVDALGVPLGAPPLHDVITYL